MTILCLFLWAEVLAKDPNLVEDGCVAFGERLKQGLFFDKLGGNHPRHVPRVQGYTLVWPIGSAQVVVGETHRERRWENVSAVCDCPAKPFQFYVGSRQATQCVTDCPSGLGCFGWQCKVSPRPVCIHAIVQVTVEEPPLKITVLRWKPPRSAPKKCQKYAKQINGDVMKHEGQHKTDALDAIKETNRKYKAKEEYGCGPTEADARSTLRAKIEELRERVRREVFLLEQGKTAEFHDREPHPNLALKCGVCEE